MRAIFYFRWVVALALALGTQLAAHATHILGGELTYAPIASTTAGVPRYRLTTILYRNSSPGSAQQPTLQMSGTRTGCGSATGGSFQLTVPLSQVTTTYSLGCPTAAGFMYEVLLFETDVDLPAGQWVLSVAESNRSAGIINLVNSINAGIYLSAYLDNTLVGQNASPKFLSTLLPYLCNGQAQRYSFSAFDGEGDSLVYQFRQPEQAVISTPYACGTPIPGTLSPHFRLDAATGALTAVPGPVQQGIYSMAARVSEYRRVSGNWQLIGYVTRDVSYFVVGSLNQNPHFTALTLNGGTTPQPPGQLIRVQPGQTVTLGLTAADPDAGQVLRFASQSPAIIPGFNLQTTSATTAQVTWQVPTTLPPGRYTAAVAVLDNGCPNASEDYTLSFLVAAQPLASRADVTPSPTAFPMPFREQVQFRAAAGGQAVTVVDALGRVVAHLTSQADGRVRWQPAAALPAGLYLAHGADGRLLARLLRAGE
ncbi:MAG: hypothetical protein EOO36_02750 [Cytophagaceae bacterium]|nr:MAG: hypothetical protein EOO36_02750 [Cytophagaceae bacterium]